MASSTMTDVADMVI